MIKQALTDLTDLQVLEQLRDMPFLIVQTEEGVEVDRLQIERPNVEEVNNQIIYLRAVYPPEKGYRINRSEVDKFLDTSDGGYDRFNRSIQIGRFPFSIPVSNSYSNIPIDASAAVLGFFKDGELIGYQVAPIYGPIRGRQMSIQVDYRSDNDVELTDIFTFEYDQSKEQWTCTDLLDVYILSFLLGSNGLLPFSKRTVEQDIPF